MFKLTIVSLFVLGTFAATCFHGLYKEQNVGLYYGVLPTNQVLQQALASGNQPYNLSGVASSQKLNGSLSSWEFTTTSFDVFVRDVYEDNQQGKTNIQVNNTNTLFTIQVQNQMADYYVGFTLTSQNYTIYGAVELANCPYNYSFEVTVSDETDNYYTVQNKAGSLTVNFQYCTYVGNSFYVNYPLWDSQLLNNLNYTISSNNWIQDDLQQYYEKNSTYQDEFNKLISNYDASSLTAYIKLEDQMVMMNYMPDNFTIMNTDSIGSYNYTAYVKFTGLQSGAKCQNLTMPVIQFGSVPFQDQQYQYFSNELIANLMLTNYKSQGFNFLMNQNSWRVDYLPWFTGGWNNIDHSIYVNNPLNTPITGLCALNPSFVTANSTGLIFNVVFECSYGQGIKGASPFKVTIPNVPFIPNVYFNQDINRFQMNLIPSSTNPPAQFSFSPKQTQLAQYYIHKIISDYFLDNSNLFNPINLNLVSGQSDQANIQTLVNQNGLFVFPQGYILGSR